MGHLIRVAFVLSRHDALMDLLSLFGEQPKALTRLRKLRNLKMPAPDGTPKSKLVDAFQSLGP
ncbi:hypothetical protein MNBD_ALPHA02-2049, partial [hydrothermal vent metagenome]